MTTSPFDHNPDPEVGEALRESLAMRGEGAFVRRVRAAAEPVFGEPNGQWWSVLGSWARPGLVAAAGLAAAALLWTGLRQGTPLPGSLANPIVELADEMPVPLWLADQTAPDVDVVLASASGF